jgi:hypothetical protein
MTDQHPLTDELIEEIAQFEPDLTDPLRYNRTNDMRAAADWQLEQVIKWLKGNLGSSLYVEPVGYSGSELDADYVIEDLQKAMRPTQENN